jgi:hypothetical protein
VSVSPIVLQRFSLSYATGYGLKRGPLKSSNFRKFGSRINQKASKTIKLAFLVLRLFDFQSLALLGS